MLKIISCVCLECMNGLCLCSKFPGLNYQTFCRCSVCNYITKQTMMILSSIITLTPTSIVLNIVTPHNMHSVFLKYYFSRGLDVLIQNYGIIDMYIVRAWSPYTYCWHIPMLSLSMKQIILNETKYAIGLIYGHCITLF